MPDRSSDPPGLIALASGEDAVTLRPGACFSDAILPEPTVRAGWSGNWRAP